MSFRQKTLVVILLLACATVLFIGGVAALRPAASLSAPQARQTASPPMQGYNVIYIVMDALRPDHLGCYGYSRNTSPFIDKLAQQGMVFEHAFSASSYTGESTAALFSGVLPSANPAGAGWFASPLPGGATLAECFHNNGYATGLFSDHPFFNTEAFWRGFDVHETGSASWKEHTSGHSPEVVEKIVDFAQAHRTNPYFVYVHFVDPHAPYEPPDETYHRFAEERYPDPVRVYGDLRAHCPQLIAEGFGPGDPRFDDMVTRYDAEIAFVDQSIQSLVDQLKSLGALDRTLIILSADHGEEFLDHGFVEHAWTVYNESIHVPSIWWAPKAIPAGRTDLRISLVDVYPTLLELTGIRTDRADLAGLSIFKNEGGSPRLRTLEQPIFAELLNPTRNIVRSVMLGDYKLLRWRTYYSPEACAEVAAKQPEMQQALVKGTAQAPDIWGPVTHEELYNIADDPHEQHNILAQEPYRYRELLTRLRDYETLCHGTPAAEDSAPAANRRQPQSTPLSPEVEEQMRALGYTR